MSDSNHILEALSHERQAFEAKRQVEEAYDREEEAKSNRLFGALFHARQFSMLLSSPLDDLQWGVWADAYIDLGRELIANGLDTRIDELHASSDSLIGDVSQTIIGDQQYLRELLRLGCQGRRDELRRWLHQAAAENRFGSAGGLWHVAQCFGSQLFQWRNAAWDEEKRRRGAAQTPAETLRIAIRQQRKVNGLIKRMGNTDKIDFNRGIVELRELWREKLPYDPPPPPREVVTKADADNAMDDLKRSLNEIDRRRASPQPASLPAADAEVQAAEKISAEQTVDEDEGIADFPAIRPAEECDPMPLVASDRPISGDEGQGIATAIPKTPTTEVHRSAPLGERTASSLSPDRPPNHRFEQVKGTWHITFEGLDISPTSNLKGLVYYAKLLEQPYRAIECIDLECLDRRVIPSRQVQTPSMTEEAKNKAKSRLAEIEEELRDASTREDVAEDAKLGKEKSEIIRALASASGVGGKDRFLDSTEASKAAGRVKSALATVRAKLNSSWEMPALAAHLYATVKEVGDGFIYKPGDPHAAWNVAY